jgi:hypothetical protein
LRGGGERSPALFVDDAPASKGNLYLSVKLNISSGSAPSSPANSYVKIKFQIAIINEKNLKTTKTKNTSTDQHSPSSQHEHPPSTPAT